MKKFKIAVCQNKPMRNKSKSVHHVIDMIEEAANGGRGSLECKMKRIVILVIFYGLVSGIIAEDKVVTDYNPVQNELGQEKSEADKTTDNRWVWTPIRLGLWKTLSLPPARNVGPFNFSIWENQKDSPENIIGISLGPFNATNTLYGISLGGFGNETIAFQKKNFKTVNSYSGK